jgi:hypothetical protein
VRLKVTIAAKFNNPLENIFKGTFFSIFLGNLNTAYDYFSYSGSRLREIQEIHPRKQGGDCIYVYNVLHSNASAIDLEIM